MEPRPIRESNASIVESALYQKASPKALPVSELTGAAADSFGKTKNEVKHFESTT